MHLADGEGTVLAYRVDVRDVPLGERAVGAGLKDDHRPDSRDVSGRNPGALSVHGPVAGRPVHVQASALGQKVLGVRPRVDALDDVGAKRGYVVGAFSGGRAAVKGGQNP